MTEKIIMSGTDLVKATDIDSGADYMRRAGPLSQAGSVCRDLGTSVKHTKNQLRDYMEKSQPG